MKTLVCTAILRISISVAIVGKSLGESNVSKDRNRFSYVCLVSIAKASCTGAILTTNVVLTASQCMLIQSYVGQGGNNYAIAGKHKFALSSVDSDKQIQKRKIKQLIPYSDYFDIFKDDILLLKLEKDFELNSYVSIISVMNRATFPKTQQELCEMLSFKESKSTMSLERSRVVAEHPDHCLMWTEEHRLSSLCSRFWKPTGVCEGNSGAPLVCQDMLTGIFKAAFVEDVKDASCDRQIGFDDFISFTYVGYYVPWIHIHAEGVTEKKFDIYQIEEEASPAAALRALVLPLLASATTLSL